ncbi:uncharacterized protein [Clytia hemisphaerica]|uniref:uncharacterized protein n=1 Tax=Clytia hemisphaerica TaxID=252671 RepID=UPI0034D7B289
MEGILRKIVREIREEEMSNPNEPGEKPKQPKQRKRRDARLSGLIRKINENDKNSTKDEGSVKTKKLHIKWKRFCPISCMYKLARAENGGGVRLLEIPFLDEISIEYVMNGAIAKYFSETENGNCNKFQETVEECSFQIISPKGDLLDNKTKLWAYIQMNGLVVSKSTFIFQSKSAAGFAFEELNFSTCPNCASSDFLTPFGNCLKCNDSHYKILTNNTSALNQVIPFTSTPAAQVPLNALVTSPALNREPSVTTSSPSALVPANALASSTPASNGASNTITSPQAVQAPRTRVMITPTPALNREPNVATSSPSAQVPANALATSTPASNGASNVIAGEGLEIEGNEVIIVQDEELQTVRIHRLHVAKDLILFFKSTMGDRLEKVRFKYIDPLGREELGEGDGVARDVISSFWQEVSDCLMIGEGERVPYVRHDYFEDEWNVVGRIIVYGFRTLGYFPIVLSKAFVLYCLGYEISQNVMVESFKRFLSDDERKSVEMALSAEVSEDFFESDKDFGEFLDNYKVRSRVTNKNASTVMFEVAQQELIQKPHLMSTTWKTPFENLKYQGYFNSPEAVDEYYNKATPTTKKVTDLLKSDPKDDAQREAFGHTKRFVRGLDSNQLKEFMKFTTGSDLIIIEQIELMYSTFDSELARRPFAHTCGPILRVPSDYGNYCDFRAGFIKILKVDNPMDSI